MSYIQEQEQLPDDDLEGGDEGDFNSPNNRKVTLDKADRSLAELYRW